MKKNSNKGFTLAEMLIVVAIIGVLIAIVTTTISNVMERAREATDLANIRSACSELNELYLLGEKLPSNFKKDGDNIVTYVKCVSTQDNWQTKGLTMDGTRALIGGAYTYAPSSIKPLLRVRINKKTGEIDFNREFPGKTPQFIIHKKIRLSLIF